MSSVSREEALGQVFAELDTPDAPREGQHFFNVLARLRDLAEDGSIEAAKFLGELLAFHGPAQDPGEAYKWFYIALSQTGFSVAFEDTGEGKPYYCGQVGDFRNESMVSELIVLLGIERIHQLDSEAEAWLNSKKERW